VLAKSRQKKAREDVSVADLGLCDK
jgi:hypothetical protein